MKYMKPEPGMPIMVQIGGRSMELIYTLKTLKDLAKNGVLFFKDEGFAGVYQDPSKMAVVLYYGLYTMQNDITQDWIESHVTAPMLVDLAPILAYAITGQWRETNAEAAPLPNVESPGIGSLSGPLDDTISASVKPNSGA